jgi:AraC-like DNA-binding protein/mannose-6-phosphate isomerase-like protein (cupin superfamily)
MCYNIDEVILMKNEEFDLQIDAPVFAVSRLPSENWSLSYHTNSDFYVLALARSGKAEYRIEGNTFTVSEGDILFIKKGERYEAKSYQKEPWSFYSVAFTLQFGSEHTKKMLNALPSLFSKLDTPRAYEDFTELYGCWTKREKGCLIRFRSLVLDIFSILIQESEKGEKLTKTSAGISEVIDVLRQNYSRSYSLAELSKIAGLSCSHFRTLFKKQTGLTAVQFQQRLKIEKAKELMLSGSCNVTKAAEAVGFSDIFYFSRSFKKITGKSPSEYL